MKTYTFDALRSRYEAHTNLVLAECSLATELVGGQPAGPDGVRAFVTHHLKLAGQEAESAINRILKEEVGERDVPSETGELKEKLSYAINVVRQDDKGPWLGDWMVKACLKQSASRLGIFQQKRGTKGDVAEMGTVFAHGISALDPRYPQRVYLRNSKGDGPAQTYFQEFMGRVQTPQGSKSVITDSECVNPGSRFEFGFRYAVGKISEDDVADMFACAMVIGLGSAKSFERGKFRVERLTLQSGERKVKEKEVKEGSEAV